MKERERERERERRRRMGVAITSSEDRLIKRVTEREGIEESTDGERE